MEYYKGNRFCMDTMIHPKFAWRVASRYVTIYQRDGFADAQKFLVSITSGDTELQQHLVPFIMDEGNRRK